MGSVLLLLGAGGCSRVETVEVVNHYPVPVTLILEGSALRVIPANGTVTTTERYYI